jgi:hypothetical protein
VSVDCLAGAAVDIGRERGGAEEQILTSHRERCKLLGRMTASPALSRLAQQGRINENF